MRRHSCGWLYNILISLICVVLFTGSKLFSMFWLLILCTMRSLLHTTSPNSVERMFVLLFIQTVGYCQGMSGIGALLLMYLNEEVFTV